METTTAELISLDEMREIIRKHDPEDLLKMGCPKDEYDSEIERIYEGVNSYNPQSPVECANIFSLVWFWSFGDWSKPLQYHPDSMPVGRDIWTVINPRKSLTNCTAQPELLP